MSVESVIVGATVHIQRNRLLLTCHEVSGKSESPCGCRATRTVCNPPSRRHKGPRGGKTPPNRRMLELSGGSGRNYPSV